MVDKRSDNVVPDFSTDFASNVLPVSDKKQPAAIEIQCPEYSREFDLLGLLTLAGLPRSTDMSVESLSCFGVQRGRVVCVLTQDLHLLKPLTGRRDVSNCLT